VKSLGPPINADERRKEKAGLVWRGDRSADLWDFVS